MNKQNEILRCGYCSDQVDLSKSVDSEGNLFCNGLHRYLFRASRHQSVDDSTGLKSALYRRLVDLEWWTIGASLLAFAFAAPIAVFMMRGADFQLILASLARGAVVGFAAGLLPWFLSRKTWNRNIGVAGLACSVFGGVLLGMLLAVPIAILFSFIIRLRAGVTNTISRS